MQNSVFAATGYNAVLGVAAFLSYTAAVVLLFIVSLVLIIIVGAKDKSAWNRTVSDEVLESEKIYTCY